MDEYNDPIREGIEELIQDELEGIKALTIGTDERKKAMECAAIGVKMYHDDVRLGGQLLKDQEEMELARKKFVEESNRQERKLEMDEAAQDKAAKWYNQPIVAQGLVCGVSLFTLVAGMKINSGMTPFKDGIGKFVLFLKPKI